MLGAKWRSRVEEIDHQILLHQEQIALLRSERESIARDLDAIVYPVLTLPNEITSAIFIQYLKLHPHENLLRLTWVCRSWRAVAISTCRLWTGYKLLFSHPDTGPLNSARVLPILLSRAGNLPLILHFESTPEMSSNYWESELYETVSQFASQLESLTLEGFGSVSLPPHPFLRLRRLSISDSFDAEENERPHSDVPSLDAPCLREVALKRGAVKRLQSSLPKKQLTKLQLLADVADCLAFAAHTPNLQEFAVFSDGTGDLESPNSTYTILLHLRILHLGTRSVDIIRYLTLPALEQLTIMASEEEGSDWTASCVNDLMTRSGCTLRQLDIHLRYVDGWLGGFLDSVPLQSLQKLTLRAPDGRLGDLWRNIAQGQLPTLESLVVHNCQFHVNLAELVEMLGARTKDVPGVARMKSFQLSFGMEDGVKRSGDVGMNSSSNTDQEVKDALDKLHDLRAQGLHVDIGSDFEVLSSGNIDSKIIGQIRADHDF